MGSLKEEIEKNKIKQYIAAQGLKGDYTGSGLFYVIEEAGEGGHPDMNSTVTVEYRGSFLNGRVFDQTVIGKPVSFPLKEVIPGWQEGMQLFQKGGRGKLIIPSRLGYGIRAMGGIPARSVLVFDVLLVDFKPG